MVADVDSCAVRWGVEKRRCSKTVSRFSVPLYPFFLFLGEQINLEAAIPASEYRSTGERPVRTWGATSRQAQTLLAVEFLKKNGPHVGP